MYKTRQEYLKAKIKKIFASIIFVSLFLLCDAFIYMLTALNVKIICFQFLVSRLSNPRKFM